MHSPSTAPASPSALPSPQPELLTDVQAAELLGISPRTLWLLAASGELRPVHIRSCARWRRTDLLAYIAALPAGGRHAS